MSDPSITNAHTMTVTETAEMLGISRSSAYECVRAGSIPSIRLGSRIVIPKQAVAHILDVAAQLPAN